MKYLNFKCIDNAYRVQGKNNDYLHMLAKVFDDGEGWIQSIKRQLLNPLSRGIKGNRSEVIIKDNIVTIGLQYTDDFYEDAITIDRSKLLDLINQWETFDSKNAQEITFILHDDGTITMEAKF